MGTCMAFVRKLAQGDDSDTVQGDAREYIAAHSTVPDDMVIATLGNRIANVKPCPSTLRILLEGRGDPNAVDNNTGGQIIHHACYLSSVDVVVLLLEFRADIEAKEPKFNKP